MAKKNLSSINADDQLNKSRALKINKDDDASVFDDFNFDDGADTNTSKNRNPISSVREGVTSGLTAAKMTFLPGLTSRIESSMPDTTKFVGEVGNFTSDLMYMSNKLQSDLAPTILQLKKAGRALGPKVKQFLPRSLHDGYDKLMSTDDAKAQVNKKITKENAENQAIAASLDNIFKQQLKTQADLAENQKADTILDRTLASKRHDESIQQLQGVRAGSAFQQAFIKNIQIPYMKKDLELKYRHYFVAKDTLSVLQGLVKVVEKKLDEIRHNTALPEVQKLTKFERAKDHLQARTADKALNYGGDVLKRIKDRLIDPLLENATMFGDAAEMASDALTTMEDINGPTSRAATLGSIGGLFGGSYLSKKIGNLLFGKDWSKRGLLSNKAKGINHLFRNMKDRIGLKMRSLAEDHENTFLGEIFNLFVPSFTSGAGRTANVMTKDPNAPGTITNAFTLSVTTIMPGYLAKMTKLLEEIKTGKPAEELIFDTESNDFIKVSQYQSKVAHKIAGSASTKARNAGAKIGVLRGAYKSVHGDDLTTFDSVESDLQTLLQNCSFYKLKIEPGKIKRFAEAFQTVKNEHDDDEDYTFNVDKELKEIAKDERVERYMSQLLKGVKDPIALLSVLLSMLYKANGKVDQQVLSTFDQISLEAIRDDKYLTILQKEIQGHGNARHLKPFITSSAGGSFTHNEEALRKLTMGDLSHEDYTSTRDLYTDSTYNEYAQMNESIPIRELLTDPEIGGLIGWLNKQYGQYEGSLKKQIDKWSTSSKTTKDKIISSLPPEMKKWAAQQLSKARASAGTMKTHLTAKADRVAKIMKTARTKEEAMAYAQSEIFDPFRAGGEIPYSGDYFGMPAGQLPPGTSASQLPPFMLTAMLNGKGPMFLPPTAFQQKQATQAPQPVHQIKSTITGGDAIVGAIAKFEQTFKEYAEKQMTVPDILAKMLDVSGAMSAQLDRLIGNTTGTLKKAYNWVKDSVSLKKIGSGIGYLAKAPFKLTGWTAGKAWDLATWGGGHLKTAAKWGWNEGLPMLGSGIKAGWKGTKAAVGAIPGLLGLTSDVALGKLAAGWQKVTNAPSKVRGFGSRLKESFKDKVYIDVFRKDKMDPGNPLLTKKKQLEGVVFVSNGKKLLTTFALNEPVMDPETNEVLVTKEDIEAGLVDIEGNDIMGAKSVVGKAIKGALGMMGKGFKGTFELAQMGLGGIMGLLTGGGPLLQKLLSGGMDLGFSALKTMGSGISTMTRRLFGLGDSVNAENLKTIVGDRLDVIIALLRKKFNMPDVGKDFITDSGPIKPGLVDHTGNALGEALSGGARPGDEDGDGGVDSIFKRRKDAQKAKEEEKNTKERRGFYSTMKSIKDSLVSGKDGKKKSVLDYFKQLLDPTNGILGGILGGISTISSAALGTLSFLGTIGRGLFSVLKLPFTGLFNIGRWIGKSFRAAGKLGKIAMLGAAGLGINTLISDNAKADTAGEDATKKEDSGSGIGSELAWFLGPSLLKGGLDAAKGKLGGSALGRKILGRAGSATNIAKQALMTVGRAAINPFTIGVAGGVYALDKFVLGGQFSQGILNYIGVDVEEFLTARCKLYGVGTEYKLSNTITGSLPSKVIELEERVFKIQSGNSMPFRDRDFEIWTRKFDLDDSDPEQVKWWVTWYRKKFLPICIKFFEILKKHKVSYDDIGSLDDYTKKKVITTLETEVSDILRATRFLNPDKASYLNWRKEEDKIEKDTSSGSAQAKADALKKAQEEKRASGDRGSEKYDISGSQAAAIDRMGSVQYEGAMQVQNQFNELLSKHPDAKQILDGSYNVNTSGAFKKSGGAYGASPTPDAGGSMEAFGATGAIPKGGMTSPGSTPDLSGVDPKKLTGKPGDLGSYVAQFESGKKGTAMIAFDEPGGTSYGTYQLSSRQGSLAEFVEWCKNEAPDVYRRLKPILNQANTGSKKGLFPNEWLALVKEGKITHDLEYKYYMNKFYGQAMRNLRKASPELAQFVESNRALQECLWSCAVQHGPAGCVRLFTDVYKPGMTPEQFLRQLYSVRFTDKYFPKLAKANPRMLSNINKNRGPSELGVMLGLLGQSPTGTDGAAGSKEAEADTSGGAPDIPTAPKPTSAGQSGEAGGGAGFSPTPDAPNAMPSDSGVGAGPGLIGDSGAATTGSGTSNGPTGGSPTEIGKKFEYTGDALKFEPGISLDGAHPRLQQAVSGLGKDFAEQFGKPLIITSGKRSLEKQKQLYAKDPKYAAKPSPYAPHIAGVAVDAKPNAGKLKSMSYADFDKAESSGLFKKHGLYRPLKNGLGRTPSEPWHLELIGARDPKSMRITDATLAGLGQGVDPQGSPGADGTGGPDEDTSSGVPADQIQEQTQGGQSGGTSGGMSVDAAGSPAGMDQYNASAGGTSASGVEGILRDILSTLKQVPVLLEQLVKGGGMTPAKAAETPQFDTSTQQGQAPTLAKSHDSTPSAGAPIETPPPKFEMPQKPATPPAQKPPAPQIPKTQNLSAQKALREPDPDTFTVKRGSTTREFLDELQNAD